MDLRSRCATISPDPSQPEFEHHEIVPDSETLSTPGIGHFSGQFPGPVTNLSLAVRGTTSPDGRHGMSLVCRSEFAYLFFVEGGNCLVMIAARYVRRNFATITSDANPNTEE